MNIGTRVDMPDLDIGPFLDRFPHLAIITKYWGSARGRELISSLALDERGGERQGFPFEHGSTLMRLLMEHDRKFPQFEPKGASAWGIVADEIGARDRPSTFI